MIISVFYLLIDENNLSIIMPWPEWVKKWQFLAADGWFLCHPPACR
jgi:hypothetical protein